MKIGFNMLLWTAAVTEEHYPILESLKETGYDGVEIELSEGTPDDYAKIGEKLDELGLERTVSAEIPDEARNLLSADPKCHQAGIDHLKWSIDCCEALGAQVMCGPFYQPLGVFSGEPPTDDEKKRGADAHREAADYADGKVVLAVEALNRFECYFLNIMEDLVAHVERVDHPNLGLMYDTFHANIEENDPVGCIAEIKDHLRHVHISENNRGTPGRGHNPFADVFKALRSIGYDNWVTIEAFGRSLPELAAATRTWRDLSGSPEEVYTEGFTLIKEGWENAIA